MYLGDRVTFFAAWSTWRGLRGTVTKVRPGLWVLIDGDTHPVAVSASEVEVARTDTEINMSGAE